MSSTEPAETFGDRVRDRRRDLGMSQAALASEASCSESALWGIESNRRYPSLRLALALADALDVTVDYLARGER